MKKFVENKIPQNGLLYNDFVDLIKNKIEQTDSNSLDADEKHLFDYTKLNYQRMLRIDKTYKVPFEIENLIKKIDSY